MNILITGTSRGIGKAIKEQFELNNHKVFAPTRKEMDVSNVDSIIDYLATLEDTDIEAIINCAGINNTHNYGLLSDEMNTNLYGPKTICDLLLPSMVRNRLGRILNIGSIWIDLARTGRGKYSMSKSALHAYAKQIAIEYGQYGILCNTLSPGFIATDMTYKNNTDEELSIIQNEIPIKRLGTPQEIAKLAYFLIAENSFINGQNIIADGGYSVCA